MKEDEPTYVAELNSRVRIVQKPDVHGVADHLSTCFDARHLRGARRCVSYDNRFE